MAEKAIRLSARDSGPKCAKARLQPRLIDRHTLPDKHDAEPSSSQQLDLGGIALAIGGEFVEPERAVALGDRAARAPFVMVPEAAVDEDRPAAPLIGEVRATGEMSHIAPVVPAEVAQGGRDQVLGLGPPLSHPLHQRPAHRIGRQQGSRHELQPLPSARSA
jgi:hypothetical protein